MTPNEALTLLAIIAGPITAVFATRYMDDRKERHERRMNVFRVLMRTRRVPTSAEHVGALNLIEIEFAKDVDVLTAWRDLFSHFARQHARRSDEIAPQNVTGSDRNSPDARFSQRLADERQRLLAKLLHAMAKALDFKIEQLEIFEGGYTPQGWEDEYVEQRLVRSFLLDLYSGRSTLPVVVFNGDKSKNEESNVDRPPSTPKKTRKSEGLPQH